VSQPEQLTIERGASLPAGGQAAAQDAERAARNALRSQVARLERELCWIVTEGFPHLVASPGGRSAQGPRLLGLAQLEALRDELAGRVQELRRRAQQRAEHELRAQELLERMKVEPGRYKWVRLPVTELGQRGCGVWHVRPRFGLLGMLAGWWELKLSSGCPLARGPRCARGPGLLEVSVAPQPAQKAARADQRLVRQLRPASADASIAASVWRWRSVIDPTVFFSDIGICAKNLRQRVCPQRRWLIRRSATAMLWASQGQRRITSATSTSSTATLRLRSARARRTWFARARARMCCGAIVAIGAVAFI
jgi:hypothetical protein